MPSYTVISTNGGFPMYFPMGFPFNSNPFGPGFPFNWPIMGGRSMTFFNGMPITMGRSSSITTVNGVPVQVNGMPVLPMGMASMGGRGRGRGSGSGSGMLGMPGMNGPAAMTAAAQAAAQAAMQGEHGGGNGEDAPGGGDEAS